MGADSFFFFSSRRRHTRFDCDWSSDVCSSDLYRAAEAVARELRATAIVTGESVGQVSSQTLDNLRAIGEATALPVLRPLIGFGKIEIIARARTLGPAAVSAPVRAYCAIGHARPASH